jgi:hypothetical protein
VLSKQQLECSFPSLIESQEQEVNITARFVTNMKNMPPEFHGSKVVKADVS